MRHSSELHRPNQRLPRSSGARLRRAAAAAVELVEQAAHGADGVGVKLPGVVRVDGHAHLARLGVHAEGRLWGWGGGWVGCGVLGEGGQAAQEEAHSVCPSSHVEYPHLGIKSNGKQVLA